MTSGVGYGSISFHLSFDEDIAGAAKAFQDAIKNASGHAPEKILSDAHKSYSVGIILFGRDKREYIAKCGIRKKHVDNNRIERLNSTLSASRCSAAGAHTKHPWQHGKE